MSEKVAGICISNKQTNKQLVVSYWDGPTRKSSQATRQTVSLEPPGHNM